MVENSRDCNFISTDKFWLILKRKTGNRYND